MDCEKKRRSSGGCRVAVYIYIFGGSERWDIGMCGARIARDTADSGPECDWVGERGL